MLGICVDLKGVNKMVFLELLELVVALLFLLFIITQIAIPMWQNKPLWPIFRKKAKALELQLSELRGEVDEARFEKEIQRERDRAERSRGDR